MPFADYDSFEACVRANDDKNNARAYCATIKRQVEGQSEEFAGLEIGRLLETVDEHSDEMLAEFLQAAIAEQEAVEQQAEVDAVTLHFPPGGEVIDHEAGDWDQFLDDLSKHGDVFQMWKGVQRHPEDNLESHDHATHIALEADKDVTDIEAVLDDHSAVEYVIDPASVSTFDKPEGWDPADSDHVTTPDQQAEGDANHVFGPAMNTDDAFYRLDPEEAYCENEGEVFDQFEEAEYDDADRRCCPYCSEQLQDYDKLHNCSASPTDQQAVITGLSQEAVDAIERRHNVDVEVVDGEGSAAPTDTNAGASTDE